jgi:hypothetical protein
VLLQNVHCLPKTKNQVICTQVYQKDSRIVPQNANQWQYVNASTVLAPKGQTVNAEFYCNVLRCLREDIRRKRPELWCAGNWLLHDDNALSH